MSFNWEKVVHIMYYSILHLGLQTDLLCVPLVFPACTPGIWETLLRLVLTQSNYMVAKSSFS